MIKIKNGEINETINLLELLPEYKLFDNVGAPITYLIHKDAEYWSMQITDSIYKEQDNFVVVGIFGAPILFTNNDKKTYFNYVDFYDLIIIRHKNSLRLRKIKRILDNTI